MLYFRRNLYFTFRVVLYFIEQRNFYESIKFFTSVKPKTRLIHVNINIRPIPVIVDRFLKRVLCKKNSFSRIIFLLDYNFVRKKSLLVTLNWFHKNDFLLGSSHYWLDISHWMGWNLLGKSLGNTVPQTTQSSTQQCISRPGGEA